MNRRPGKLLILYLLVFCIFYLYSGGAFAEAFPVTKEENHGLIPSEDIEIPVFTEDNMKMFSIPDNEAMQFSRRLKAGWNLGNTFDAQDEGKGVAGRDY